MSAHAYAERLGRAIESTGFAVVMNASHMENQITVLCRVHKGSEISWRDTIIRLHKAMRRESKQAHAWRTHSCKDHFIMEKEGEERFGFIWHVSITSTQMKDSLDFVTAAIRGEQPKEGAAPGEVTEMAFTGMEGMADRNAPTQKKKGVWAVESNNSPGFRVR